MFINNLPQAILSSALKSLGQKEIDAIFSKGEIVEGSVVKSLGQNQAIVRFRGVDLLAVTKTPLAEGQKIVGKVEAVVPQFTVSLLSGETANDVKSAELMRFLLPSKAPMGSALGQALVTAQTKAESVTGQPAEALKNLANDIEKLMSANLEKMAPKDVQQAFKNSGVYLESLLRKAAEGLVTRQELKAGLAVDLKANLSKALNIVEGKIAELAMSIKSGVEAPATTNGPQSRLQTAQGDTTARQPQEAPAASRQAIPVNAGRENEAAFKELSQLHDTAKSLRSALSSVEVTQLINTAAKKAGAEGAMLYQIPYMQNGQPETARIYVKPDDERESSGGEGKKEGKKSLVFMLNMTKIGAVRVDVNVREGHAAGMIYVENEDVALHARQSLSELVSALEPAGYRTDFTVRVADKRFLTEELETVASVAPKGLVNIKA